MMCSLGCHILRTNLHKKPGDRWYYPTTYWAFECLTSGIPHEVSIQASVSLASSWPCKERLRRWLTLTGELVCDSFLWSMDERKITVLSAPTKPILFHLGFECNVPKNILHGGHVACRTKFARHEITRSLWNCRSNFTIID
jgi:hypothetical protein